MRSKKNLGSVLVESAIFIPLVLLLVSGTLLVGQLLLDVQTISRAAYEGARIAAKTINLELAAGRSVGQSCTKVVNITYNSYGAPTSVATNGPYACAGHETDFPIATTQQASIHARVNFLMALYRLKLASDAPWITSMRYDASLNRVTVSIRAKCRIEALKQFTISVSATQSLPYLAS
jgi:hypothetical protein